jgi:hypothetical protein
MKVITKQGKQGEVKIDSKKHTAVIVFDGVEQLIAFVRDQKKVVVKNDMILHDGDLASVRAELSKFIKKEDNSKKKRK